MVTAFLSIAFILILYRVLRRTNQALALFGTISSIIGFVGVALSDASTFYAFAPLSNLYHNTTATTETKAAITLLWEANQGITYTFTFVGSLFLMIGFIVIGIVMVGAPSFGRRLGWTIVITGVAVSLGVVLSLVVFETIGFMFLADLLFLLLIGRKLCSLSKG